MNTPMLWVLGVTLLTAALMGGCAGTPTKNAALTAAEAEYAEAKSDPAVLKYAGPALEKAGVSLERAAGAENDEAMTSFAYIGSTQTQTAIAIAERAEAEQRMRELRRAQERMQLEAREAELAALKAERTARGIVVTLGDVLFDLNKATLAPGAMGVVDRLAEFMRNHPNKTVLIEGHTDSLGSHSYNQSLSESRAYSVRSALIMRGIEPERIQTRGFGETRPLVGNSTPEGRQRNRRVEVIIRG
jgi:outer membrane protein OmpA-like peptidoglycan-associated protein